MHEHSKRPNMPAMPAFIASGVIIWGGIGLVISGRFLYGGIAIGAGVLIYAFALVNA